MPGESANAGKPIGILHLSDLHFKPGDSADAVFGTLRESLEKRPAPLDFVVVSGDFTDRGERGGFTVAGEFLRKLQGATGVPWERFVFCPGNHDIEDVDGLFALREKP